MSSRRSRSPLKVLCVTPEAIPFAKTGGLGDVCGSLPPALLGAGMEVTTALPLYARAREHIHQPLVLTDWLPVEVPGGTQSFRVISSIGPAGQRMLFFDHPELFDRPGVYGENGRDYGDNGFRYGLFCKAVIEAIRQLPEVHADLFHIHDWQASFLPVLRATTYRDDPLVRGIPIIMTIHNLGYQGLCDVWTLDQLGLPKDELYQSDHLEYHGRINPMKGGLIYSDAITTVSRRYAREIEHARWGAGLEGIIRSRRRHLIGILNGIDESAWDPRSDDSIAERYDADHHDGKRACRRALLQRLGLQHVPEERPIVAFVGRMAEQKGIDIIQEALHGLIHRDLTFVFLGTGDPDFEQQFRDACSRWPDRVAGLTEYTEELAHQFIAGSDMLLVPSRFEPCGLVQLYALRYGTIPVVHKTGGLADTVIDASEEELTAGRATGFQFEHYTKDSIIWAIDRALQLHTDREAWAKLMRRGMSEDFSWDRSAKRYAMLFRMVHRERAGKDPITHPASSKLRVTTTKGPYMEWGPPLPARYEQDVVRLRAQSPTSLFAYYEISTKTRDRRQAEFSAHLDLWIVLNDQDRGDRIEHKLDVDFGDQWFQVRPTHDYRAELQLRDWTTGQIVWSLTSEAIRVPSNQPSPRVHARWQPVEIPEGHDVPMGLLGPEGEIRGLDFTLVDGGRPNEVVDWPEPVQRVPRHLREQEGGLAPPWGVGHRSAFLSREQLRLLDAQTETREGEHPTSLGFGRKGTSSGQRPVRQENAPNDEEVTS